MTSSFGKRGIAVILGLCFLLVATLGGIILWFPGILFEAIQRQYEIRAGVIEQSVVVNGYTVPYYSGGKNQTLVLIHGFGDSKISFVQMAEHLTAQYYVVMPEVPGFGETAKDPARTYSIDNQVETLHQAFRAMGLDKFILGGNSMGGHIAAAYALKYPEDVTHLILIDAAGLKVSDGEPYADSTEPIRNEADFDAYMQKLFVTPPPIPGPFKKDFIRKAAENFDWQNKIRADIRGGRDYILNERIGQIRIPTLILWGDKDQLVEVAVGDAYNKGINGSRMIVFSNCGHSPQYERPKETADAILKFLSS